MRWKVLASGFAVGLSLAIVASIWNIVAQHGNAYAVEPRTAFMVASIGMTEGPQSQTPQKVRVGIRSCEFETMDDMRGTLTTCMSGLEVLPLESNATWDVLLVCRPHCMMSKSVTDCDTDRCPVHAGRNGLRDKFEWTQFLSRVDQRFSGFGGRWWTPGIGIGDKNTLCRLSNSIRIDYGYEVTAPCFVIPGELSVFEEQWPRLKQRWTHWLFKPTLSSAGRGIRFINPAQIADIPTDEAGSLVGYISDPILYSVQWKARKTKSRVKADLRIYGVVASLDPLRVYVSSHGHYRAARPDKDFSMDDEDLLLHITNKAHPKDILVDNPPPKQGEQPRWHPGYTNRGGMAKWWRMVEQNGLKQADVWSAILDTVAVLHSAEAQKNGGGQGGRWDFRTFTPFFADVGVDRQGRVTLYETHPACSLKPCLTKRMRSPHADTCPAHSDIPNLDMEVRPASWGSIALGIAHWLQPDIAEGARDVLQMRIDDGTLPQRCNGGEAPSTSDVLGCLSPEAEQVLITMAAEEKLAPALNLEDVFGRGAQARSDLPAPVVSMWSNLTRQVRVWYAAAGLSEFLAAMPPPDPMSMGRGADFGCSGPPLDTAGR